MLFVITEKAADMVLVILMIILVHISETNCCNIKVCLTWSALKDEITFKCRVNALKWQVRFYNQFHKEQAHCVSPKPFPDCYPHFENCTITQDALHNMTMLTVRGRIDNSINGGWTCYHGTNVDKAVVNVTVLREAIPTGKPDEYCWEKNTVWTFFGVLIAIVALYIIRCIHKENGIMQDCKPSDQCVSRVNSLVFNKFKPVILFLLIIVLISLPILIGIGKVECPEQYAFIVFGFIMVFPVTYLLVTEIDIKCCQLNNNDESHHTIITDDESQLQQSQTDDESQLQQSQTDDESQLQQSQTDDESQLQQSQTDVQTRQASQQDIGSHQDSASEDETTILQT